MFTIKHLSFATIITVLIIITGCNQSSSTSTTPTTNQNSTTLPAGVASKAVTMVYSSAQNGSIYQNGDTVLFTFSSSGSLMLTTQYTVVADSFELRGSEYIWVDSSSSMEYALSLLNGEIHEVNMYGVGGSPFYGQFTIQSSTNTGSSVTGTYGGNMLGTALTLNGDVTTLSGQAGVAGNTDGTATTSSYYYPTALTTDSKYLYVVSKHSDIAQTGKSYIRKVLISSGDSTTVTGPYSGTGVLTYQNSTLYLASNNWLGSVDTISGTSTQLTTGLPGLFSAGGLTSDGTYLYVSDANSGKIQKVAIADGTVTEFVDLETTTAGITGGDLTTDGTYLYMANSAGGTVYQITIADGTVVDMALGLQNPVSVATDGTYLYITKLWHYDIIKVKLADKTTATIAGNTWTHGYADGNGTAAQFGSANGTPAFGSTLATDGTSLYVADHNNYVIRKID